MSRLRDVLAGRWASGLRIWGLLILPSLLPVIVQESVLVGPGWALISTSIVAQHAVSAIPLLLSDVARRRRGSLPLWGFVATWISVALLRAAVGGLLAREIAGVSPEFVLRAGVWLAIVIVWIPPVLFALTLRDFRTSLVSALSRIRAERDAAERDTVTSEATLRAQLVSTVYSTVMPVVDDIRRSLTVASSSFHGSTLRAIGERLALVTHEATRIVSGDDRGDRDGSATGEPPLHPKALTFDRINTIQLVVWTAATTTILIVPLEWYVAGAVGVSDGLTASIFSSLAFGVLLWAGAQRRSASVRLRFAIVIAAAILAGIVGGIALAAISSTPGEEGRAFLAVVFPAIVLGSSAAICAISALSATNERLRQEIDVARAAYLQEVEAKIAIENRVRTQLAMVLHGPVYGRLSACVMALNFAAAEGISTDSTRGRALTEGILSHLESASVDLDELAKSSIA